MSTWHGWPARSIRLWGWPINRPQDYQPLKDKNLCLSVLGLAHKSRNWISWFSALKIVYIHWPYTVDGAKLQFLSEKQEYQRKKSVPNSKHGKKLRDYQLDMKICIMHFDGSLFKFVLAKHFFQEFLYRVLLVLSRCCFHHLVENSILYKKRYIALLHRSNTFFIK